MLVDMAKLTVGKTVEGLGEYLHEQRRQAQMSLRQLAESSGGAPDIPGVYWLVGADGGIPLALRPFQVLTIRLHR